MKKCFYIIFILLSAIEAAEPEDYSKVGLPIITNYSQDEYQAHNQNWDILQADNHLIYVANGNGLLEFDGESWTKYITPNRSRIRDIELVGSKIYAGNVNDIGYFQANDKGVLSYHSLNEYIAAEFLQYGDVWSVATQHDKVIFKAIDYFFIWDGKSIKTIKDETKSRVKIMSVDKTLYIKLLGDKNVYTLDLTSDNILKKTQLLLPENSQIRAIEKDANNGLIFFTGKQGIFKQIDKRLQRLDTEFTQGTYVYSVAQTQQGLFYIATINQGLYVLSEDLKILRNYKSIHGLEMNAITAVINDSQNNIWLAGNTAISVMRPPDEISRYQKSEDVYGFNLKLVQGKLNFVGQGLFQLHENTTNPYFPPQFDKLDGYEDVTWETLDYGDKTFVATNKGISLVQIQGNEIVEIENIISQNMFVFDIVSTKDFQKLFAATSIGLFYIQRKNGGWQHKKVNGITSEVNKLAIEDNDILWVGDSSAQLFRVEINSLGLDNPEIIKFDKADGIGNNKVVPFNLTMGTVFATNDGVMHYTGKETKPLEFIANMPEIFATKDEDAHLLYEDSEDRLWYRIGTHSGFAEKLNSRDDSWQVNEDIFDYFPNRSINAFVSKEKNILWFLQADGNIFRINVAKAQNIPELAHLYVRKVQNLNSAEIIDAGIVSELNNALQFESNSIRVSYALADYSIPNKALYRTKLNGSQHPKWSEWTDETYRDFTELKGNDYILEVQAKDGFGRVTVSTQLKFKVLPPFYLSNTALLIYAVLTLTLLIFTAWIVQKWRTRKLQAHNIELASLVDKKTIEIQGHVKELEQQQELKTRFFTNISHELRTPLSLIILPLQKLIRSNNVAFDSQSQELLSLSLKNANGMKQLVNQVLDVSHFEQKLMPIVPQKNELVAFVENISHQFYDWASENNQKIEVLATDKEIELYFDRQMMEKIVSNLLSNAIKYSGRNTCIRISFFRNENHAGFIIKDNGIGIAKAHCQDVFKRYFKAQENTSEHDSSGIGLDYVKEMVDLHHGQIELSSDTNQGCEFKLSFKLGSQHFSTVQTQIEELSVSQMTDKQHPEDTSVVMIVEDNNDLRRFISQSLSIQYKVIQAINGADALKTLEHELPDLILSDIMMPQMDGIEFLQHIRSKQQFKTIPFILLSSKSTQADTQLGLQYGANDYLTKPFDMDELILRVKNMINSRKLIRQQVQQQLQDLSQQSSKIYGGFEKKIRTIIIDNIADSKFNVNTLSDILYMQRTTLFRKFKQQLDISPSKYIQQVRLEIAKDLLDQKQFSVSQSAYASGFESLSYFSKQFKAQFGKPPSEYLS